MKPDAVCAQLCTHRPVNVFQLQQARLDLPVRQNETVYAEIPVVERFAEVSAVAKSLSGRVHGVVAPLPYKAAAEAGIPKHPLHIAFQIAGAVSHRMGILTQDERLSGLAEIVVDLLRSRIHPAFKVEQRQI